MYIQLIPSGRCSCHGGVKSKTRAYRNPRQRRCRHRRGRGGEPSPDPSPDLHRWRPRRVLDARGRPWYEDQRANEQGTTSWGMIGRVTTWTVIYDEERFNPEGLDVHGHDQKRTGPSRPRPEGPRPSAHYPVDGPVENPPGGRRDEYDERLRNYCTPTEARAEATDQHPPTAFPRRAGGSPTCGPSDGEKSATRTTCLYRWGSFKQRVLSNRASQLMANIVRTFRR